MGAITINRHKLNLNFEPQLSPQGRLLRLSGISLVTTEPAIWVDGMYRHNTIYSFRYLDKDEFVSFKFDAKGKFISKV